MSCLRLIMIRLNGVIGLSQVREDLQVFHSKDKISGDGGSEGQKGMWPTRTDATGVDKRDYLLVRARAMGVIVIYRDATRLT